MDKMKNFISIKLIKHVITMQVFIKRSTTTTTTTIQSKSDLGSKMKSLNDNKQFKKALDLFDKYNKNNIEIYSSFIITQALKACASIGDLQRGSTIHHLISSRIKDDYYILASLIHLYMQCGDVVNAESLFNKTKKKTLSIYGAMMKGYIKNNMSNKAIDIFNKIENPNEIILNLLFNACAELKTNEALDLAKETSKRMSKSFHSNPYILSSFLDALMKCGDIKYAQSVFDKSKEKVLPMYGAMMKGYIIHNQLEEVINLFKEIKNPSEVNLIVFFNACAHLKTQEALDLLKKISKTMPKSYYSNHRLLNALLDGFIKCGDSSTGEILFSKMKKTVENYGNLMTGFNQENYPEKTLDLFNKMKKDNIEANIIIYLCIIKALAYIGDYSMSESIIKQIPYSFVVDNQIKAALI
ncbi:unnamed protein product, partial [Rotaria sp. Silwood1]